jgi:hypothetical protein
MQHDHTGFEDKPVVDHRSPEVLVVALVSYLLDHLYP